MEKICKNCKYFNQESKRLFFAHDGGIRSAEIHDKPTCDLLTMLACTPKLISSDEIPKSIGWIGDGSNPQFVSVKEDFGCVNFVVKE